MITDLISSFRKVFNGIFQENNLMIWFKNTVQIKGLRIRIRVMFKIAVWCYF